MILDRLCNAIGEGNYSLGQQFGFYQSSSGDFQLLRLFVRYVLELQYLTGFAFLNFVSGCDTAVVDTTEGYHKVKDR